MDLDLGDLKLQADEESQLELNKQMERFAGRTHLQNLESGRQGVV